MSLHVVASDPNLLSFPLYSVDNRIRVQVEGDRRVVLIDPDEALDRGSIAQQERYQIAKSSHIAVWLERGGPSTDGCLSP